MDIKILKDMFLTIERGNLWKRQDQIIYKRIMVDLGLLKSGKSGAGERDRSGKPEENSWDSLQDVDPHREEYLLGRTAHSDLQGTKRLFTIERGNLSQRIF